VGFSEIEAFPSAVLAHHYPDVPNLGDMTKYKEWNLEPIDLLVGGTPCQSFSVAGLRRGLEDPRGNLALTYVGILDRFRPKWCVWENVPGVLSSNGGRDFGSFLGALVDLGYGFAYRVLDAQYFGVAQRRRRVFVVGYLGDWRRAAAVLFERESLRGDPAPSRKAREEIARVVAPSLTASNDPSRSPQSSEVTQQVAAVVAARMVAFGEYVDDGTASAMKARDYKDATDLVAIPIHDQATRFAGKRGDKQDGKGNGFGVGFPGEPAPTLTKGDKHAVAYSSAVRRLTPTECERLQGFQDGYTNIPWRKAIDSPDGPRYKSLGNSMAVPVMKWIGERIKLQMLTPAS
jgi:DNA (cytosine-5)-methyltransferase 1